MPDRADFVGGFDCAELRIDHRFEHEFDCRSVIFHILLDVKHLAVRRLLGQLTALERDALADSLENRLLRVHIDKLIFERRTACVDNENFHNFTSISLLRIEAL